MKDFMKNCKLRVNRKKLIANSKKTLAMLLAVAMVTGAMPASTAYAAESNTNVTTEATDVTEVTDAAEAGAESADSDATVMAEGDATGTTDGSEYGEPADIIVENLYGLDEDYGYPWNVDFVNDGWVVSTVYDESEANPFDAFVKKLEDASTSYVRVNTEETSNNTDLENQLKFQWQQKGADGAYANMAEGVVPVGAGEYKLVISIDKKFAVADDASVDFVIEKKEMYVTYDKTIFNERMDSGHTVKEVKELLAQAWGLADSANGAIKDTYKVFVNDPVITVKESLGTEALADDTVMKLGSDYSIWIAVTLKEQHQANCVLVQRDMINLRIEELVDTEVVIINNHLAEGADLIRPYTGEAVAAPTVGGADAEITVKVLSEEVDPATGEQIEITPAEGALTFRWEDANGVVLEGAPTDANAYYYRAIYTDAEGIYATSDEAIRVVVEPATLVLKPAYSSESDVFAGTNVNSVLRNVSYGLFSVDANGVATEFTDFDKDTFWGVSYNNPEKVQNYNPVFALEMGQTTSEKVGEEVKTNTVWTKVTGSIVYPSGLNKIVIGGEEKDVTVAYRIVFTGNKGLFENGVATSAIDVNTVVNHSNTNYVINTNDLAADAITLEVKANANAVIDVTAMLKDGKGATYDNAYTKVYDGEHLYADRAEYKKAVVKSQKTNSEIARDTDSSLSYLWYTYKVVDVKDEKGNVVKDEAGNPKKEVQYTRYDDTDDYDNLPQNAGQYCLKVVYKDPTNEHVAEPAYVYFNIQKQLVKSVIGGEPTAYTNTSISAFEATCPSTLTHKLYLVPGNDMTLTDDKLVDMTEFVNEWNTLYPSAPLYSVDWYVEVGDNTKEDAAKFNRVWGGTFQENLLYRVGAEVKFLANRYTNVYYYNFTNNYEVVEEGVTVTKSYGNTLDINVKKMGDIVIDVRVDEDKRGAYKKVYDGTGFDLTKALESGYITLVEKNTDNVIPVIGEGALDVQFVWEHHDDYLNEDEASVGVVSPSNARTYSLYISFAGNDKYKNFNVYLDTFIIEERDLFITPVMKESIEAGLYVGDEDFYSSVVDMTKTSVTGYIDADASAFGNGILANALGLVFDYDYGHRVYDEDGDRYYDYLRTGKNYGIETIVLFGVDWDYEVIDVEDYLIWERFEDNYNIVEMRTAFTPNVRGTSSVYSTNANHHKAEYAEGAAYVTPLTAVPHYHNLTDIDGDVLSEGNYFTVRIQAPTEFMEDYDSYTKNFDRFVFKNEVEKAGGYVLSQSKSNGLINVAFPVEDKTDKSFVILWEEGYTETYNICLTKAECMADLRDAVAPKSLSFNNPNKKMFVGETQQLDVKIGRVLSTDVVLLNYDVVDGTDVMSVVKDTGVVTALKPGTATVEVYPVRLTQDGEYERIADFKKKVTVKIKVQNVSAPKIGTLKAYDTYMYLEYKIPEDGYRREVYVLPGKGLKAADFESKIAANGNADFAGYWEYIAEDEDWYRNYNNGIYEGAGRSFKLQPDTDYTVYVRNVSAIRETADGKEVAASAAGSVKSFKTTKRQFSNARLDIAEKSKTTVVYNEVTGLYDVPLSAKSFNVDLMLRYLYKDSQVAADASDYIWLKYALSKQDQAYYMNPKLEFFVIDDWNDRSAVKTSEYKCKVGNWYYKASKLATFDKKGNVKLKGVGVITLCIRDTVRDITYTFSPEFNIYANVTKIDAKKLVLKEGSAADLYKSLTFYDGKTKLNGVDGFRDQNGILQAQYELFVQSSDPEAVEIRDGYICAMQPDKKVTLTIALASNPTVSTTMEVNTKAMDAIKGLKVYDITDVGARASFTHTANLRDEYADYPFYDFYEEFKVTIQDSRGSIVESFVVSQGDGDLILNEKKTNFKKGVYAYELDFREIGLYRQSNYTVSIAPMFNHSSLGKAVSKKFKTTNIPASYEELGVNDYNGNIWVGNYTDEDGYTYEVRPYEVYLVSGNTYTLRFEDNLDAEDRMSDKLTWKSTNTKVASVKANTGTFTATFKALKPGVTDIEIVSKVTKKVIARHQFVVIPVRDGVGAYGAWEPVDFENIKAENGVEPLDLVNPTRFFKEYPVNSGYRDYFFATFTAPFDGEYTFSIDNDADGSVMFTDAKLSGEYYGIGSNGGVVTMEEGQTIDLTMMASFGYDWEVDFSVYVSAVKAYNKLILGGTANSKESNCIRFVAPADNYYTFSATKANMVADVQVNGVYRNDITLYHEDNSEYDSRKNGVSMAKGDILLLTLHNTSVAYDVTVQGRVATALSATAAVATGELKEGEEKWFSFTAPVAGNYTFASAGANAELKADYYTSIMNENMHHTLAQLLSETGEVTSNFSETMKLDKDEEVLLRVYAGTETAVKAEITVSQPKVDTVSLGVAKKISIEKDKEVWVGFEVPTADTEYCFDYEYEVEKDKEYEVNASYFANSVDNSNVVRNGDKVSGYYGYREDGTWGKVMFQQGNMIYVKLTSTSEETVEVTVTVTATTATALEKGKEVNLEIEDGGMYFYTFKAPNYGLYTFESVVATVEGGNHNLEAHTYSEISSSYEIGSFGSVEGSDFYAEKIMATGEEIIFAVNATNELGEDKPKTKAVIKVNEVTPIEFHDKEISLEPGEKQWIKFTAKYEDTYTFSWNDDSTAVVYASATLKENMQSNGTYSRNTEEKMVGGSNLYFKVCNNSTTEKARIQFTVKSATPEIPTDSFNMEENEVKKFKYVVEEEGRYVVSIATATEEQSVSVTMNGSSCYDGDEFYAKVGETYVFVVTATTKAGVTLKVEQIVPETFTDAVVKMKAGETRWYEYVVPHAGRYNATVTDKDGKDSDANVTYREDDMEDDFNDISNLNGDWFEMGQSIFVKVSNETEEELSVKVAIEQIAIEDLAYSEELKLVSLKKDEEKWFRFRADEDAYYTFTVNRGEGMSVRRYQNDRDSYSTWYDGTNTYFIKKGVWYDIKVTGTVEVADGAEAPVTKLGVVKESFLTFTEKTDLEVTAKNGVTVYAKFDAPATDFYSMIVKELPENVTVTINGTTYNENSRYLQASYIIGKTYYYEITLNFTPEKEDETKTVKLYIDRIAPATLENSVEVTVNKGMKSWFVFKAPETGRYTFTDSCSTVYATYDVCEDNVKADPEYTGVSFPEEYVLYEGDELYIATYYTAAKDATELPASATVNIKVKKAEAKAINSASFKDTMEPNSINWYSYTASNLDNYKFAFKKVTGSGDTAVTTDISVDVHSEIIYDRDDWGTTYEEFMEKGDVVYFCVENTSNEKADFQVVVTTPKELLNMNDATVIEYTESGTKWLYAEIGTTGWYTINRINSGSSHSFTMYNNGKDNVDYIYSGTDVYYLEKGSILVEAYGASGSTVTLNIQKVATFNAEEEYEVVRTEDGYGYTYVECKISNAGYYRVTRNDNGEYAPSSVYYRVGTSGDSYISNGSDNSLGVKFQGDSVLFRVYGNKDSSTTLKVYADTTYSVTNSGTILSGIGRSVDLDSYEGEYYTFTAPVSGYYDLYCESTDSYNGSYCEIYNMDGTQKLSSSGYGGDYYYSEMYLEKGEQIRYLVRGYGWNRLEATVYIVQSENN